MGRVVGGIAAGILMCACAGSPAATSPTPTSPAQPTAQGTITLAESGCTLSGLSAPVRAGRLIIAFENRTSGMVAVEMGRITDPHTYQELVEHIAKERQLALESKPSPGRPVFLTDVLATGHTTLPRGTLDGDVRSGTYGIVCIGPSPAGARPFAAIGPIQVQ